jgi:two-component system, LytTR family, response regulator
MNALIIDDERLARLEFRRLLAAHPEIEICGEAANGPEAVLKIAELRPDVIFLDIQMPGQTGFEMLGELPGPLPLVVFVTAYDEHALRAFEFAAADYLVKPVTASRLAGAIARLTATLPAKPDGPAEEEEPVIPLAASDRVFVRDGDRCWFVAVREIHLLESEGNHTRLHLASGRPLIPRSLRALEERLPDNLFFRANRAQIINVTRIERIEPWFGMALKVWLHSREEGVELSRRQTQIFREMRSL